MQRELNGVLEEIREDLDDLVAVKGDRRDIRPTLDRKLQLFLPGHKAHGARDLLDHIGNGILMQIKGHVSGLQFLEIQNIVEFIAKQAKPSYEMEIHQQLSKPSNSYDEESGIDEDEDIIQQCIEVIRSEQKASVSLLQRRLRLGYGRAARIMDELENRGIVGPSNGAEPRDILIDLDGEGADGRPPSE